MHSFRNTELSTTRTAGLSPDQRPGIVGDQKKVASSSRMDFDAVPPSRSRRTSPRAVLSAGFRDEVDQHKQIELFASFCCMVGDGGAGSGGSHWTQLQTGTQERWSAAQ